MRADCKSVGFNGAVPAGEPDLYQVVPLSKETTGPNGGYVPVYFNQSEGEWDQDMKIVWTYTYGGGTKSVSGEAPFHTLPGPDSDGDGVPDIHDECLSEKGTLPNGCMPPAQSDPDGDGVFGEADLCPTVNGKGALNGCPGGVVPPPPSPPPVVIQTGPPQVGVVLLAPTVAHRKASAASAGARVVVSTGLSIGCPAGGPACSVALAGMVSGAQAARAGTTKAKSVVVGTLHTSVPAGRTLALRFPLTAKGAALLRKHHKLKIALAGSARTGGGPTTRISSTITVTNPPKKHGHR